MDGRLRLARVCQVSVIKRGGRRRGRCRRGSILALGHHHFARHRRAPRAAGIANAIIQGFLAGRLQAVTPGQPTFADRGQRLGIAGRAQRRRRGTRPGLFAAASCGQRKADSEQQGNNPWQVVAKSFYGHPVPLAKRCVADPPTG
ncbi:hypothetical protein D3C80_920430 [compost metagenome]